MAKKYAFVDAAGAVVTFTNVSAQTAAENPTVFIEVKDDTLEIGDVVDKKTGALRTRSRKTLKSLVKSVVRRSGRLCVLVTGLRFLTH